MSNEIIENSVMMEAQGLVNGARAQAYGHPQENFQRICALWNAYLHGRANPHRDIDEKDHAIMMVLVKIARLQETPDHRDSLVDICGYAGTYEKLLKRQAEQAAEIEAAYEALAAAIAADKTAREVRRTAGYCAPCGTSDENCVC